ncbi:MAG: PD-(D/E)XK nuclease family protein [Nitrospirota bacterium]
MNPLIISPEKGIIDEIIPLLKVEGVDYSSNLIVFPGKRPSHFLRKEISRRVKKSFIPPLTLSMDEFVDYVFEKFGSGRKIETIDAVSILYEIHRSSPVRIGKDNFMSPDSFFPIGLKIFNDLEELYIEGVSVNHLKNVEFGINETIPTYSSNMLQSLSYFYEEFYKRTRELGFSTRSFRYKVVSEEINKSLLNNFHKIIFAGFFALTLSEKRLFKKLLSFENAIFLFQEGEGLKERIKDLDVTVGSEYLVNSKKEMPNQVRHDTFGGQYIGDANVLSENRDPQPKIFFYSSPDTHGEIYALSAKLKNKPLDTRTVIVLPSSETLFPLIRQGLTIDEDNYNISLGYPLYRTPIFGFLNNLMELTTSMEGELVYIPYYLRFMLHPYTKNIYFKGNAEITRIILHALEERFTKKRTMTFLTLSEIEENIFHLIDKNSAYMGVNIKDIQEHLRSIHQNTIKKFMSFKNIKDFTIKCKDVLTYIYNNSTAKLHPLFHPFAEAFIKEMDAIGQSLMKEISFEKVPTYFTFFRKYIMNCRAPFEGAPLKGLQILGFLETRNIKFNRIFFLDVNEEVIPDTKKEDSLIPMKVKEMLGLPTYMDRDKIMAYYFDILLRGAKEVHLFFIENDRKERSRFVERLLWERQKKDITIETKEYIQPVQYRISLASKNPEQIEKTESVVKFLKNFTYSPTVLDDYLKCQLRFYYSHVINLEEKEEITGEIEKVDIGKIVHNALRGYFSKRTGRILKEKDIDIKEMDNLTNKIFEKEYGSNIAGAAYLLKKQIKNHLREFLERYYIPLIKSEAVSIFNVEDEIKIRVDSFNLKGRIDSIEKRGRKTVILDYKTSSNKNKLKIKLDKIANRETWSDAIGSLQIPFYLMLYSEKMGEDVKYLNGIYLLLGYSRIDKDKDKGIEISPFEEQETEKAMNILRDVIFKLLREIVDPATPFAPPKDIKRECPRCNFRYICGTQWVRR